MLVVKARAYVDSVLKLNPATSAATENAILALNSVNERAKQLASTMKRSLSIIPNSQVSLVL